MEIVWLGRKKTLIRIHRRTAEEWSINIQWRIWRLAAGQRHYQAGWCYVGLFMSSRLVEIDSTSNGRCVDAWCHAWKSATKLAVESAQGLGDIGVWTMIIFWLSTRFCHHGKHSKGWTGIHYNLRRCSTYHSKMICHHKGWTGRDSNAWSCAICASNRTCHRKHGKGWCDAHPWSWHTCCSRRQHVTGGMR